MWSYFKFSVANGITSVTWTCPINLKLVTELPLTNKTISANDFTEIKISKNVIKKDDFIIKFFSKMKLNISKINI